jgi:Trk K+ transport system NAD-binding subunit
VPGVTGDASEPDTLELAGIRHPMCQGVIAVTASDEINLKIAITSKLLHPDIPVACRSEFKDVEDNMLSFGTDYIVNPYETFADIFSLVMLSPSHHLIYDWLTGAPNTNLTDPIYFSHGSWVLCGYGRFGVRLYKHLSENNIPTTIIDPVGALKLKFDNNNQGNLFIIGTGTDAETLKNAGIESAAGLIAGSDNDSNNLSIIMTARELNPDIFIVARQNIWNNQVLYSSTNASLIMHPREIIARKIRAFFLTPLLINFVELIKQRDAEWANVTISRLSAVVGESRPHVWTVNIDQDTAPAVVDCLNHGRSINIGHLTQDPGNRKSLLACVPLLLVRNNEKVLMPEDKLEICIGDQILFCGTRDVKNNMRWTLKVLRSLNYVMTFTAEPESLIWRILYRQRHKTERRHKSRDRNN